MITHYDLELLEKAKLFLHAAGAQQESRSFLEKYGFNDKELERGRQLVTNTERSFEWEREGKAWNFLSPTAERRTEEARYWYADTRRRYLLDRCSQKRLRPRVRFHPFAAHMPYQEAKRRGQR